MRWLPRLLSHAAASGRIPARTTTSHGFASGGRGSRRGFPGVGSAAKAVVRSEDPKRRPDAAAKRPRRAAVADAAVRSEEPKKRPDAAKRLTRLAVAEPVVRSEEPKKRRRDAAAKKPRRTRTASVSLIGGLADAARSFVNSKVAALGSSFLRVWGTASKGDAPSTSCHCQHGELDLARVQAKLKPLLSREDLIITRRVEWAKIFGFQQETRYIIKNPRNPRRKTPVGLIREKSNFILRQLLRSRRPFIAEFTDHKGKEILKIRRPFRWINSSIYAEVDGKEIGVVHSRWHLWRRIYDLYIGNRRFAVVKNPGFWDWTFPLLDENDNVVAIIDRKARGIGLELFKDAGQYAIMFGNVGFLSWSLSRPEDMGKPHTFLPLALPERAVALALAVSLDRDYFSRTLGWGNTIFRGRSRRRGGREDDDEFAFWVAAVLSSSD